MYEPIANLPVNYTNSQGIYSFILLMHNQVHTTVRNNCVDLYVLFIYMCI